ncbi:MAG: helix-turn-helix transcriptional regulator, partial [Patescibacteria group bacterium]
MKIENVVRERLLKDPKFRKEYESKDTRDLTIRVSSKIQEARIYSGFTQTSLAKKMKTHQSSVARAERGNSLPSLTFLQKIAEALGTYLVEPSFGFLEKKTQGWR